METAPVARKECDEDVPELIITPTQPQSIVGCPLPSIPLLYIHHLMLFSDVSHTGVWLVAWWFCDDSTTSPNARSKSTTAFLPNKVSPFRIYRWQRLVPNKLISFRDDLQAANFFHVNFKDMYTDRKHSFLFLGANMFPIPSVFVSPCTLIGRYLFCSNR